MLSPSFPSGRLSESLPWAIYSKPSSSGPEVLWGSCLLPLPPFLATMLCFSFLIHSLIISYTYIRNCPIPFPSSPLSPSHRPLSSSPFCAALHLLGCLHEHAGGLFLGPLRTVTPIPQQPLTAYGGSDQTPFPREFRFPGSSPTLEALLSPF